MSFRKVCELLREFDYEKNGIDTTVEFLVFILNELVNGGVKDGED